MVSPAAPSAPDVPDVTPEQFRTVLEPLDPVANALPLRVAGIRPDRDGRVAVYRLPHVPASPDTVIPAPETIIRNNRGHVPLHVVARLRRALVEMFASCVLKPSEGTETDNRIVEACAESLRRMDAIGLTEEVLERAPFQIDRGELQERIERGDIAPHSDDVLQTLDQCTQLGVRALEANDLVAGLPKVQALVLSYDEMCNIAAIHGQEEVQYFLYISPGKRRIRVEIIDTFDDEGTLNIVAFDEKTKMRLFGPIAMTPDDTFVMYPEQFGNHNADSAPPPDIE